MITQQRLFIARYQGIIVATVQMHGCSSDASMDAFVGEGVKTIMGLSSFEMSEPVKVQELQGMMVALERAPIEDELQMELRRNVSEQLTSAIDWLTQETGMTKELAYQTLSKRMADKRQREHNQEVHG